MAETRLQNPEITRRKLFRTIGAAGGSTLMYQAMAQLGYAKESGYTGPIKLEGDVRGATVLILGAGLAGMCAALELRKAGYKVQILEYNDRAGGRNWTITGGETIREMGGFTQRCQFDAGLYFNPGPWRIPYHHTGLLDYCRRLNVALEPFTQVNYNAFVHSAAAGKARYREVEADFNGHVAELLAKTTLQGKLDEAVTREDREMLVEALREWGALDKNCDYKKSDEVSNRRGFDVGPGGGLAPLPVDSEPKALNAVIQPALWTALSTGREIHYQSTMFHPVGGMGMIGRAFARELGGIIQYNCKVVEIRQDAQKTTVRYQDTQHGAVREANADWCICTIPASILGQIPLAVGAPMKDAIDALSYVASVKAGLQFKRRFWEEDEAIFGGITYTDQPISLISYPSTGYFGKKGVLLGAYAFGPHAFELTAMSPNERLKAVLDQGTQIHPQYPAEFESGVSVGWHRMPWTLGCFASWTDKLRAKHYDNLCAIDGRIMLAGEHASRLPAWQEGAILSALDVVGRLHQRVMARGAPT
jgi:monoamine oxidase